MSLRSGFGTSNLFVVAIVAVVVIWSALGNTSPAVAFEGDTRGNAIEVRKDRRETARSEPVIRHLPARQSSQSTTDDSKSTGVGEDSRRIARRLWIQERNGPDRYCERFVPLTGILVLAL